MELTDEQITVKQELKGKKAFENESRIALRKVNFTEELKDPEKPRFKKRKAILEEVRLKGKTEVAITGDGNCLFRGLAWWLYKDEEHHLKVRKELLQFGAELVESGKVKEYPELGLSKADYLMMGHEAKDAAERAIHPVQVQFQNWLSYMQEEGTYGDSNAIVLASEKYNTHILVEVRGVQNLGVMLFSPRKPNQDTENLWLILRTSSREAGNHYNVPTKDLKPLYSKNSYLHKLPTPESFESAMEEKLIRNETWDDDKVRKWRIAVLKHGWQPKYLGRTRLVADETNLYWENLDGNKLRILGPTEAASFFRLWWSDPKTGLGGRDASYAKLKDKYLGLSKRTIEELLEREPLWQQSTGLAGNRTKRTTVQPLILDRPLEHWQIDLIDFSSFDYAEWNAKLWYGKKVIFRYILTVIDCFSKYAYTVKLASKTEEDVAKALEGILKKEKPSLIQSDNGPEFKNKTMTELCKKYDVKQSFSRPYTPQAQGSIERFNRSLKMKLKKLWNARVMRQGKGKVPDPDRRWVDSYELLTENYNNSVHSAIGATPFDVHTKFDSFQIDKTRDRLHRQARLTLKHRGLDPDSSQVKLADTVRILLSALFDPSKARKSQLISVWTRRVYKVVAISQNRALVKVDPVPKTQLSTSGWFKINEVKVVPKNSYREVIDYYLEPAEVPRVDKDELTDKSYGKELTVTPARKQPARVAKQALTRRSTRNKKEVNYGESSDDEL